MNRTYKRVADGNAGGWLQDGRRFVYTDRGRVHLFDVASSTTREMLGIPGEVLFSARLAANDSRLFFMRSANDSDIWLVRFGDQK